MAGLGIGLKMNNLVRKLVAERPKAILKGDRWAGSWQTVQQY
jgi:hypothetical protein